MLLALALATLSLHILVLARLIAGGRAVAFLRDEPPPTAAEPAPSLSIVLAARDEARAIEVALRSMLAQRYAGLDIVAVDDRSSDGTGEIMDRLAAEDGHLRVLHVSELPPGWLGKNHALYLGAQATTGEWILFTDGDVMMEPEAAARAVAFCERRGIDFLAVPPRVVVPTWLQSLLTIFFTLSLFAWVEPWKARRPGSKHHIGTGAFNLVRRSTYVALGTHRRIALRPDDDMKLAKAAKLAGGRLDVVAGEGLVAVEWYASARELAIGLRKNMLAGLDYRVSTFVLATAGAALLYVWPVLALPFAARAARLAYLGSYLLAVITYAAVARRSRPWLAPLVPLAAAATLGVMWAAILRTLRKGGIEWRGTFYPLDDLKRNVV